MTDLFSNNDEAQSGASWSTTPPTGPGYFWSRSLGGRNPVIAWYTDSGIRMSCDQTVIVLDSDEGRDWMATQEIEFWPEPIVFTKQPQELSSPAPGSVCFTHYAEHCKPPWLAIHRESAMRILSGYRLTDAQKSDVGHLMAGYCNVLERAGLLYYGDTEGEAVAKACGLIPPNVKGQR